MNGEHLEATKRILTQMRHWWNLYTTADDIPSIGTVAYGLRVGGKNKPRRQTEEIALELESLSPEAERRRKWVRCVRDEMVDLQKKGDKSPNKVLQDRLVCSVLFMRAGLGYKLQRIADAGFKVPVSKQRISNYYGIAVWNVTRRAERMGLFDDLDADKGN